MFNATEPNFPSPRNVALTAALLFAPAPTLAIAYDLPMQMAWDQAVCDARFAD